MEKKVEEEVRKGIDASGGRMSVLSLVEEYTAYRMNPRNPKKVKPSTQAGYGSVIANRPQFDEEPVIWDEDHKESASGFLFFTNRGKPMMETDVAHYFTRARERFNEIYKKELPEITPHVCRHTFCSNMATRGMPLLMLKEIMGHSDVTTTANIYTHVGIDALSGEIQGGKNRNYVVYAYNREADIAAPYEDAEQED